MVKHTTLRSQTVEIHRSLTTVTSNHDVPTVGQPTEETPDAYSLVDTTEKAVEVQVVDENLPVGQTIIDSRLASIDPRDAFTPQRDEPRNKEEPCYLSDTYKPTRHRFRI